MTPSRARRRGAVVLLWGVVALTVYVLVAAWAGRTGPLVRRPLLDGFIPSPYNWVSPPPELASQNKAPSSGRFEVELDPDVGSRPAVESTDDTQASLALDEGTIPPSRGQARAILTMTPLAADGFGPAPSGLEIAGNVYRIQATYQQSMDQVTTMRAPGQLVLAYPAEAGGTLHTHVLLMSTDGKAWTTVPVTDSRGQQLVQGTVTTFGFFAVGRSLSAAAGGGTSTGTLVIYGLVGLAIAVVVLVVARTEIRLRRERRAERPARKRQGKGPADP